MTRRRLLLNLLLLAMLAVAVLPHPGRASAAPAYSIALTPSGALVDGQVFLVTVTGVPGMTVLNSGFCDPAMPDADSQDDLTEWCTDTIGNGTAGGLVPSDPDGVAVLTIRAGVGNATKTSPALGTTHSWVCDRTSPCKLPLVINLPGQPAVFDTSTQLTYRPDDPTAGCVGSRADQIASSAPDRLTEQWAAWTVARCAGGPKPTTASFENDGRANGEQQEGAVDLAYTAVPPGREGFGAAARPVVPVPVALNATVIAAAGYYPSTSSVAGARLWRRVDSVAMTYREAAALLSGHLALDEDLQGSLIARNPQFASQGTGIGFTTPGALAGPQATTLFASSLLSQRQPEGWTYPNSKSKYEDKAGTPLGTFGDYNQVFNSLAMVNLATGKPQIVGDIYRKLAEKPESVSLITFYLTDLATARQLGLTPVALGDGDGPFVAPTEDSLRKAVPALQADASGFRLPGTAGFVADAYPLTFLEYATAPAEQLLDEDCTARTAELAALKGWLDYLVTDGQEPGLFTASGLVPLPDALAAEGKAAVAKVGASTPSTGPCAPETTTTTTAPTTTTIALPPAGTGGLPGGSLPIGGLPGDLPLGGSPLGGDVGAPGAGGPTRKATPETVDDAREAAARATVPALLAPFGTPAGRAALALPALVGLASANGWLATGRPLPRRRRAGTPT